MLRWRILFLRPARKDLECLPGDDRKRILDSLATLEDNPQGAALKKIQARIEWTLQLGTMRILLIPQEEQRLLVVTSIGPLGAPTYSLKNIFR